MAMKLPVAFGARSYHQDVSRTTDFAPQEDPMNQYVLKRYAIGRHPALTLEKAQYDQILVSKRQLLEHLAVEELFDVMIGNYEELERELLSITLRDATYFNANDRWTDSIDTIQLAGRRVANLLTTTHGYCDQVPHAISTIVGKTSEQLAQAKTYFRDEYDSVRGYRVCTELRRYMQHRGTAVHGFNAASSWIDRPDGRRVRVYTFAPQVNVRRLRDDPKFKRSVLTELDEGGSVSKSTGEAAGPVPRLENPASRLCCQDRARAVACSRDGSSS